MDKKGIADAGPRLKAMNDALERDRMRLTDAEREAICRVYDVLCDRSRELQSDMRLDEARPLMQWAKTLQGLWERTGGGE